MIGFARKLSIIAIVLLSASVAYAGDLRPAPSGGNNMHPAPQSKEKGIEMAETHAQGDSAAANAVNKTKEDQLRRLRPVK